MQTVVKLKQDLNAKPFVKWAGGKGQLLDVYNAYYPNSIKIGAIKCYIEPFVGGGAVLFDILQRFHVEKSIIVDINEELINTYRCIKSCPDEVIRRLSKMEETYLSHDDTERKSIYYSIRDRYNSTPINGHIDPAKAADFIFLNRTCFNGLYRVNKSGKFNVPIGSYKNPTICDEDNIWAVSTLLQKTEICHGNYTQVKDFVDRNCFVYFDPPYRPLSTTSSFTSYSDGGFDDNAQKELAKFYTELHKTGAKLMLSNSDPKNNCSDDNFFDELYAEYNIYRVSAKRNINSNSNGRGRITEILVTNY